MKTKTVRRSGPAETSNPAVVIVGTGFSGLGMAIALKKAGNDDFLILEKADEVGGTWRENTYPGCACDIRSHLYSYSFELKPDWSREFAPQREILDYIKHCVDKYDLRSHIRFNTEVTGAEYDDDSGRWQVFTGSGDVVTSQALVVGMGPLHQPNIPQIPGMERFEGKAFHSAEWDHSYDLAGKRVAVIGTGSSAIQFVPRVAREVASLTVYQRTPPWIVPKPDRKFSRLEKRVFRFVPGAGRAYRNFLYWQQETFFLGFKNPKLLKVGERLAKWHLRRQVPDPELRRRLTPDYTMGCKRIIVSSDYYPTFTRPNADLVTDGIAEIRERSIVTTEGAESEVDAIIFGTGFHVTDAFEHAHIVGKNGLKIQDAWRDGIEAHLGVTVAGFPNLFLVLGPNSGLGHNSMIIMIEAQIRYIADCLKLLARRGAQRIEVRPAAQERYNRWIQDRSRGAVWVAGGCKSWYLDKEGVNRAAWPASTVTYWRKTKKVRKSNYTLHP